jgi:hypothetical protein
MKSAQERNNRMKRTKRMNRRAILQPVVQYPFYPCFASVHIPTARYISLDSIHMQFVHLLDTFMMRMSIEPASEIREGQSIHL